MKPFAGRRGASAASADSAASDRGVGRCARQPAPGADLPRGLGVARQPGAGPPRQPRPAAGHRVHGRRARRRTGRPLRPADAVLALSFGRRSRRRHGGRRGAGDRRRSCGWRPRLCFALSTALYLSYATVGRDFLSFQWDNLLLECGFWRCFCRPDRPRRSFTSCFVWCCSSSTSSRASPSGSRSSATGRTAAR